MKVVPPVDREQLPPSEEKLNVLAKRAQRKLPLFQSTDTPETFEEHDHYLHVKDVYSAIGYYLSLCKTYEHDDEAEVTFSQVAKCIRAVADRPQRYAHLLPPPCTSAKTKTSTYVWKWHEVKHVVRKLMAVMTIKKIAMRL